MFDEQTTGTMGPCAERELQDPPSGGVGLQLPPPDEELLPPDELPEPPLELPEPLPLPPLPDEDPPDEPPLPLEDPPPASPPNTVEAPEQPAAVVTIGPRSKSKDPTRMAAEK